MKIYYISGVANLLNTTCQKLPFFSSVPSKIYVLYSILTNKSRMLKIFSPILYSKNILFNKKNLNIFSYTTKINLQQTYLLQTYYFDINMCYTQNLKFNI